MASDHRVPWWTSPTGMYAVSALFAVVTLVTGVRLFWRRPGHSLPELLAWIAFAGWIIVPIAQMAESMKRLQRLVDGGQVSAEAFGELNRSAQVSPVLGYVPLLVGLLLLAVSGR